MAHIQAVKDHLHTTFSIKDLVILHYFLEIEIAYLSDGIVMSQSKFTKELLQDCQFDVSKKDVTPLPLNLKHSASAGDLLPDPDFYRSFIGKLNFLTNTRPDLSYTVQLLSRFMQAPHTSHYEALQHTLRYLNHTVGQRIKL